MKNENAIKYIENLIKGLVPTANVNHYETPVPYGDYAFRIEINNNAIIIEFAKELVNDFEGLINNPKDKNQYNDLKTRIDFKIYMELGKEGVIRPDFKISQKLLEEKIEWRNDFIITTLNFAQEDVVYEGLKKLSKFHEIYQNFGLNIPEAQKDKKIIDELIKNYESNENSFKLLGNGNKVLEYLKAASITEIINYEKSKKQNSSPRILKSIDKKIYSIVSDLKNSIFYWVKPPECIIEYAQMQDDNNNTINGANLEMFKNIVTFASNKIVFLAHRFNEKELRDEIGSELKKNGFELKEGKVEDLGYITEDILNKIKESGFFMALITPAKKFEDGKFSTSSWILMEIGAAISYGRKVLILAEDCIDTEEYSGKLQRDCQHEIFNRSEFPDKLKKVTERIKKEYEKK